MLCRAAGVHRPSLDGKRHGVARVEPPGYEPPGLVIGTGDAGGRIGDDGPVPPGDEYLPVLAAESRSHHAALVPYVGPAKPRANAYVFRPDAKHAGRLFEEVAFAEEARDERRIGRAVQRRGSARLQAHQFERLADAPLDVVVVEA